MQNNQQWFVYMVLCDDSSFYTGISLDVQKRFAQHKAGKGARYTRIRGAQELVFVESHGSHRSAAQREIAIKKLSRTHKQQLIAEYASN